MGWTTIVNPSPLRVTGGPCSQQSEHGTLWFMKQLTQMTCATVNGQGLVIMEVAGEEPVVYTLGKADESSVDTSLAAVKGVVACVLPDSDPPTDGVIYTVPV